MARRSKSTTFAGKANTFCPGLCARASQMRESRNLGQASLATSVNYMQLPQNPHRLLFLLKSASRTSAHESATEWKREQNEWMKEGTFRSRLPSSSIYTDGDGVSRLTTAWQIKLSSLSDRILLHSPRTSSPLGDSIRFPRRLRKIRENRELRR